MTKIDSRHIEIRTCDVDGNTLARRVTTHGSNKRQMLTETRKQALALRNGGMMTGGHGLYQVEPYTRNPGPTRYLSIALVACRGASGCPDFPKVP